MPVSQVLPSLVNNKPVALPDSTVPSLSTDKPVIVPDASVPTYLSSSQPPSANDATPVNVAEQVPLVTPGQLLSTTSSTIVSSHALHTSAVVLSSKAAPSTVPSSQATLSVASPTQVASSSVLSQQVEVTSESKPAKQREWKAKQPVCRRVRLCVLMDRG
jgi:protein LSM14